MESTARFSSSDPDSSEKSESRTQTVGRHDLASRFSSEQQQVPPAQREAMGRALLEGVMFDRSNHVAPERQAEAEKSRQHHEWHRTPLVPVVERPAEVVGRPPARVSEQATLEEAARQPVEHFEHTTPASNERRISQPVQRPEYRPPIPEQASEGQQEALAPELRPGERLVRSEWHTIIVGPDGRPVERNQYGQGFLQEQHVEQLPDATVDAQITGGKASPSDDHAMMGSSPFYQHTTILPTLPEQPSPAPSLPSGMTTPTLPTGQPVHEDPQHLLAPPKSRPAYRNPLVWIFFLVLLATFFAASLAG